MSLERLSSTTQAVFMTSLTLFLFRILQEAGSTGFAKLQCFRDKSGFERKESKSTMY